MACMAKCFIDNKVRSAKNLDRAAIEALVLKEVDRLYVEMDI